MSNSLQYTFTAAVKGGPKISVAGELAFAAYSVASQEIADGEEATIEISPDAPGQFLVITSSRYTEVTYSVAGGVTDIPLDGPLLLIGPGAVGLLNAGNPTETITLKNIASGSEVIEVDVLLCRDAS